MTRYLRLACLIVAGEAVFSLPFHVPRFFRPQVLAEFGVTNTALGDAFSVYGVMAMLAYFPGGLLADRVAPRALLAVSLAATALGGLYFATLPRGLGLTLLYGYWGVTTILLLWAAMIRATREWGGALEQGRAFGWLDGGRGLVAAVLSTVALTMLRAGADLRSVILFYTAITATGAALCWFAVSPLPAPVHTTPISVGWPGRVVWLQAAIVVCAYCGYKSLDYYALAAQQLAGWTDLEAAEWFSATSYLRPLAAVAAGWWADRWTSRRVVMALFALGAAAWAALAAGVAAWWMGTLVVTIVAVYALRGVYFALLEETQVERAQTGFAVGVISLVGYTPDVFFAPVAGRLLDAGGLRWIFLALAAVALAGAAGSWRLGKAIPACRE
jgi:MFS family permease